MDTVAFAEESVRQPPSLGDQAKERGSRRRLPGKWPNLRKASTKRLAQAGGTMFCSEFG